MSSSKMMVLKAATERVNSTCEVALEMTEEEWEACSEHEQRLIIKELSYSIVQVWVEAEDE